MLPALCRYSADQRTQLRAASQQRRGLPSDHRPVILQAQIVLLFITQIQKLSFCQAQTGHLQRSLCFQNGFNRDARPLQTLHGRECLRKHHVSGVDGLRHAPLDPHGWPVAAQRALVLNIIMDQ